jgi:hypothetical protein
MDNSLTESVIRVASFNCKNIHTCGNDLKQLFDQNDIIMLQETWLYEFELTTLASLHSEFYAKGITAIDHETDIHVGRPHGGLAILWRKSISKFCKIIEYNDNRLLGLELNSGNTVVLLVNVYMPYNSPSNHEDFLFYLHKIEHIISSHSSPYCYVIGDINADVTCNENGIILHKFGYELYEFCKNENLLLADIEICCKDTFTYYSEAHGTTSWLDHVITNINAFRLITDISVDYNFVTSDHLPVQVGLKLNNVVTETYKNNGNINYDLINNRGNNYDGSSIDSNCNDCSNNCDIHNNCNNINNNNNRRRVKVNWDMFDNANKAKYKTQSEYLLKKIKISSELLRCDETCTDHAHFHLIDKLHNDIVNALWLSSIDSSKVVKDHKYDIPGWNDYCSEAHSQARDAFLLWCSVGKPRQGEVWRLMQKSRSHFKYALRYVKNNKDKVSADSLANKLMSKNSKSFWNEIKKYNGNNNVLANTVNNVTGIQDITKMWQEHYEKLLNSSSNKNKHEVLKELDECGVSSTDKLSVNDIIAAVKKLKSGKSSGLDNLNSEHYIYASDRLYVLLTLFLNLCFIHGYLPKSVMDTVIIPIIKDNKGDVTDKNNYRPIAMTTVVSKLIELIIIDKYSECLTTTDNQFGYKKSHSTDQCIFVLKQITEYYVSANSPVYICFLDASKAFDRLNYWTLFRTLIKNAMPMFIIRLLVFWYRTQTFIVQWGSCLSTPFNVSNGVRQGGVLSPKLFNVYIDELSVRLSKSHYGCILNNTFINHLFYADDGILLAPSANSMQTLLNICEVFADEFEVLFNLKKTKCMMILPKWLNDLNKPVLTLAKCCIDIVSEHNYLGYVISNDMSDNLAIKTQVRSIYAKGNMLCKHFRKCNSQVKSQLFKSYCTNLYCSSLWTSHTKAVLNSLQTAYKKTFRMFMVVKRGQTTSCMVKNNIITFEALLRNSTNNFKSRIEKNNNFILDSIKTSIFFLFAKTATKWHEMTYKSVLI